MHCKIKSIIFSLSWIVILAVAVSSFAQQNKRIIPNKADTVVGIGLQSTLGEQKRSAIVEADGYAFFSEDKTIRQLREEAIANAKRVALEQAQTYVKSFTQVENFVLRYDLVQSEAEGYLRILQSKDYGVQPDYRYRYRYYPVFQAIVYQNSGRSNQPCTYIHDVINREWWNNSNFKR